MRHHFKHIVERLHRSFGTPIVLPALYGVDSLQVPCVVAELPPHAEEELDGVYREALTQRFEVEDVHVRDDGVVLVALWLVQEDWRAVFPSQLVDEQVCVAFLPEARPGV